MDRHAARQLLDSVVPSDWGDERFAAIVNGRYSAGFGTTCAYLPALLLWSLGCRDNRLVDYDDPGGLTRWELGPGGGVGISKLYFGGQQIGCWVPDVPGAEPALGDIYYVSNGTPDSEHVGVVVDPLGANGRWHSADAGQTNASGMQCARWVTRSIEDQRSSGGGRMLGPPDPLPGVPRRLMGWVSLDLVPWSVDPSGLAGGGDTVGDDGSARLVHGARWRASSSRRAGPQGPSCS